MHADAPATTRHRIREQRLAAGLSQAQLGDRLGWDRTLIARLETVTVEPKLQTLRAVATALGCRTIDLLPVRDTEAT